MYKVVFIDLDGTLLRSDHTVSDETRKVIQKLKEMGILVVLVSARPYHGIIAIHAWLGIGDYPVASLNGSYITNLDNVLSSTTIPTEVVSQVQQMAAEFNVTILYYSGLEWFSEVTNAASTKEQLITPVQVKTAPYTELFDIWSHKNIAMNKLMAVGTPPNIQRLQSKLRATLGDLINAYTSKPTYLEIMPKSASKASAAEFISNLYQIPREESIALGDNFNDREMLIYAGKGIAMGNAPDEIKAIADEVTDTNQNDGVRKALEKTFNL